MRLSKKLGAIAGGGLGSRNVQSPSDDYRLNSSGESSEGSPDVKNVGRRVCEVVDAAQENLELYPSFCVGDGESLIGVVAT